MSDSASSLPGRFRILAICGFCVVAASAAAESNPTTAASSEAAAAVDRATADNAHGDRGAEVAHAFLHARGGVHGEVLVFRSKEGTVVETLLYSRVLKRVVDEIALRESEAWPPGEAGAADSAAYVDALRRAQKKVWWESASDPSSRDRVQELAVEFSLNSERGSVSIYAVRTAEGASGDRRAVVERRVLESPAVERAYVERDQRLIVEDAFDVDAAAAEAILRRTPAP